MSHCLSVRRSSIPQITLKVIDLATGKIEWVRSDYGANTFPVTQIEVIDAIEGEEVVGQQLWVLRQSDNPENPDLQQPELRRINLDDGSIEYNTVDEDLSTGSTDGVPDRIIAEFFAVEPVTGNVVFARSAVVSGDIQYTCTHLDVATGTATIVTQSASSNVTFSTRLEVISGKFVARRTFPTGFRDSSYWFLAANETAAMSVTIIELADSMTANNDFLPVVSLGQLLKCRGYAEFNISGGVNFFAESIIVAVTEVEDTDTIAAPFEDFEALTLSTAEYKKMIGATIVGDGEEDTRTFPAEHTSVTPTVFGSCPGPEDRYCNNLDCSSQPDSGDFKGDTETAIEREGFLLGQNFGFSPTSRQYLTMTAERELSRDKIAWTGLEIRYAARSPELLSAGDILTGLWSDVNVSAAPRFIGGSLGIEFNGSMSATETGLDVGDLVVWQADSYVFDSLGDAMDFSGMWAAHNYPLPTAATTDWGMGEEGTFWEQLVDPFTSMISSQCQRYAETTMPAKRYTSYTARERGVHMRHGFVPLREGRLSRQKYGVRGSLELGEIFAYSSKQANANAADRLYRYGYGTLGSGTVQPYRTIVIDAETIDDIGMQCVSVGVGQSLVNLYDGAFNELNRGLYKFEPDPLEDYEPTRVDLESKLETILGYEPTIELEDSDMVCVVEGIVYWPARLTNRSGQGSGYTVVIAYDYDADEIIELYRFGIGGQIRDCEVHDGKLIIAGLATKS